MGGAGRQLRRRRASVEANRWRVSLTIQRLPRDSEPLTLPTPSTPESHGGVLRVMRPTSDTSNTSRTREAWASHRLTRITTRHR